MSGALSALLTLSLIGGLLSMAPANAVGPVVVSLTFDDNTTSEYTQAYQQALQPHNVHATFFVKTGSVGAGGTNLSWAQVTTLAGDGNDIGGKTVSAKNLVTDPNASAQVCQDRQNLLSHGLTPIAFAYPGGTGFNDATVRGIVQGCGYGSGRRAGGLSPTSSTNFAETLPPIDPLAIRAYLPPSPGGGVQLTDLQAIVNNASTRGGGWVPIVFPSKVCPTQVDPGYAACATGTFVGVDVLNQFLTWVQNAGQAGQAPAGTSFDTAAHVLTTTDTSTPSTAISCNGAACSGDPYPGIVSVTLSATDLGSGIASTHYTTDGSDPTQSSPTYTGAFNVNGSSNSTTAKFRSWDYAGNVEATKTQVINAPPDAIPPTTTIACNGSPCSGSPYVDSVTVTLSATDTGGSGIEKTYYTMDGSTPTTSSTVYSGAFQLTQSATVSFFSTDTAGNAEVVQSQQLQVVPHATMVSLTFDNGTVGQYTLAYQQALLPHNAHATFFVNSGNVGVSPQIMSWSQLGDLAAAGNDIGGKTVNATNLTSDPDPTSQVCDDRRALLNHGLSPAAFAYPGGAFNPAVKDIVKSCGYGNGRSAGSLSPNGPTYAETVPPKDWFATRAYPGTGTPAALTLTDMQNLVSGASAHGGGWVQIVMTRVCSQALDPGSYSACSAASGHVELDDLDAFLDWLQNAGQPGGAPAGTAIQTVRDVVASADTIAPTTTVTCDLGPCSGSYTSVVRATLSATDVGSSVANTHFTTDGSDPTLASPVYTKPIPITSPTTLKFRSWDYAGNTEATQSQVIDATPPPDGAAPTTTIACNGAPCTSTGYDNAVTVSLTADDGAGWGVDTTFYTTDGSTPDTSSPPYTGPFVLTQPAGTYTVKFFSTDLAGNAEPVQSQDIPVLLPKTVVSLTFDDGLRNQYELAYLQALKPHGLNGTFFNVSGLTGSDPEHMTWSQLTDVNNGGNEIGGHTLNHVNLKTTTDFQTKVHEVCDDRQNLIQHGFDPVSFAYPEGAFDATAESIVQDCGYSSGRAAGGIDVAGNGAGPVYAETIPPNDPFATRTVYGGNGAPLTLSHLQASVTGAQQHGGGWIQLVFHEICSPQLDPDNYTFCINDFGPIELQTLNQFLDWLQAAGQPGGAPPRTVVQTVARVINGPDLQPPASTLYCDGVPCQAGTTYQGSVTLSLAATDPGGTGIAATYFTVDGSTPDQNSPTFTRAFTISDTADLQFFSIDNSGNVEAVKSTQVQVQPNPDPIIGAAGDIACDPTAPAFNDGQGTEGDCRAAHTAPLLNGVDAVLPIGDVQYECGGADAFAQSYDPTWGVKKSITHPVPGDKDYATNGGTDCPATPGADYYAYFGNSAGDPSKGYYSYDLGTWHIVALNTAPCPANAAFCAAGQAQEQWLANDLAANSDSSCTLAYYQNPRWVSPGSGSTYQAIWQDLYAAGVDVVLNGDSHWYERFQPMDASGVADAAFGVRQFIVGTGGAGLDTPGSALSTSVVRDGTTHGVIRMTLRSGGYDWTFVNDTDGTFTDSGTASCHGAPAPPDTIAPTTSITCDGSPCQGTYTGSISVSLSGIDLGGSGIDKTYYTTDGSTPTTSSSVYGGPFPLTQTTTVKFFSTDIAGNVEAVQSQLINIQPSDTTPPVTAIACNASACSTGWYAATPVSVSLSATDAGSGVDKTYFTTDGSTPTTSSAIYTGAFGVSQTSTVKFFSVDKQGNAETVQSQLIQIDISAPTTTITCNAAACSTGWYSATVSVALVASDAGGAGIDSTYYTTDGSAPTTSSPRYTGPFSVASTTTVRFFSTDTVGNVEQLRSRLIQIESIPPVTTITCNGGSCGSGIFRSSVRIALLASDSGGSGLDRTYYTTNGSTPTIASTIYTGPFNVSSTRTIRFFSTDKAGNAEAPKSQQITIDTSAPTTTIRCNAAACSGWYRTATVLISLFPSDTGGSGVDKTYYTTDGTTPTTASTIYTGAFTIAQTTTVRFFSTDLAGNRESVRTTTVRVDTVGPTVSVTAPTNGRSFTRGTRVSIVATASDAGTGTGAPSGVARVVFYIDGTAVDSDSSSPYTDTWNTNRVTLGTHQITAVAFDVAGNSTTSAVVDVTITN